MAKARITVQLTRNTWSRFDALMKKLGFRRDSYLNRVLPAEVRALSKVKGCDDVGAEHLLDQFRGSRSKRVQVSLRLDDELIALLNSVCEKKRVVRDLFLDLGIEFILARIEPAAKLVLSPRLADREEFSAYEKASENYAKELDYGSLLIYDARRVAKEDKLDRDLERLLASSDGSENTPHTSATLIETR